MKFLEITGGLMVPVSNDEMLVSERVRGHGAPLPRRELNEREQELARQWKTAVQLLRKKRW